MEELEFKKYKIVHTGVWKGKGNKLWKIFRDVNEDGTLGKETLYQKEVAIGSVGTMYNVERTDEGRSKTPFDIAGRWGNEDDVREWRAKSEADALAIKIAKDNKKVASMNELKELIDPVRDAYRKMNYGDRSKLLAYFIEQITR